MSDDLAARRAHLPIQDVCTECGQQWPCPAARRARHRPEMMMRVPGFGPDECCHDCGRLWPCDAAVAFAALEKAEQTLTIMKHGRWAELEQERQARQAAEAALAAILTVDRPYVLWERVQHMEAIARQALAAESNPERSPDE